MLSEELKNKLDRLVELGHGLGTNPMRMSETKLHNVDAIKKSIVDAFNRPRVGVGVIIFNKSDDSQIQILMENRRHRHGHGDGEWSLPGGWMENGETWEKTAIREAYEETGIVAESGRFLTAITNQFRPDLHCVTGFVVLSRWAMDPKFGSREPIAREPEKVNELKWINLRDLVQGRVTPLFKALSKFLATLWSLDREFTLGELAGRKDDL